MIGFGAFTLKSLCEFVCLFVPGPKLWLLLKVGVWLVGVTTRFLTSVESITSPLLISCLEVLKQGFCRRLLGFSFFKSRVGCY